MEFFACIGVIVLIGAGVGIIVMSCYSAGYAARKKEEAKGQQFLVSFKYTITSKIGDASSTNVVDLVDVPVTVKRVKEK